MTNMYNGFLSFAFCLDNFFTYVFLKNQIDQQNNKIKRKEKNQNSLCGLPRPTLVNTHSTLSDYFLYSRPPMSPLRVIPVWFQLPFQHDLVIMYVQILAH